MPGPRKVLLICVIPRKYAFKMKAGSTEGKAEPKKAFSTIPFVMVLVYEPFDL